MGLLRLDLPAISFGPAADWRIIASSMTLRSISPARYPHGPGLRRVSREPGDADAIYGILCRWRPAVLHDMGHAERRRSAASLSLVGTTIVGYLRDWRWIPLLTRAFWASPAERRWDLQPVLQTMMGIDIKARTWSCIEPITAIYTASLLRQLTAR
jgi:hypothetical protein